MFPFLVGLVVGLVVTGTSVPLLSRIGVWDVPNARSSHTRAIPRGGGVGVLAGFFAGVSVSDWGYSSVGYAVLGATVVMAAIGLLDDLRGMPVLPRLAVQFLTATVLSGVLAHATRAGWTGVGSAVIGGIWLVSYINAFNFMDGINGISSLSAAVAGAWYAWIGHQLDSSVLLVFGLALAGAAMGFLPWNAPRARVFLGDVGSYGIGAIVSSLALLTWLNDAGLARTLAPLVIYLADTAWALVKRVRRGAAWRDAHREHVYQRLVDAGWSQLLTAVVVAAGAGVIGLGVARLGTVPAASVGLMVLFAYLALPTLVRPRPETT